MQGLANLPQADSYGSTVAGVRQVAPPSGIPSASAFPPVHAATTQYQPFPESPQHAAVMAIPSQYAQPAQLVAAAQTQLQPSAGSHAALGPQQQLAMQSPASQQAFQYQQVLQQNQLRAGALPASMNGYAQARPQQRPPAGYTQVRAGGARPPSVLLGSAAQQQQRPLGPATPRRLSAVPFSPMPFKLIAPNSNVRTIPATIQARLAVVPVGARAASAPTGASSPRPLTGASSPRPLTGASSPRPQVVMGVPAAGRGSPKMAVGQVLVTGLPAGGAPAPGVLLPGKPVARPPSQPHVIVNGAAETSLLPQQPQASSQLLSTPAAPSPPVGPETPQIFPGAPPAAVSANPPSPQPQRAQPPPPQPQAALPPPAPAAPAPAAPHAPSAHPLPTIVSQPAPAALSTQPVREPAPAAPSPPQPAPAKVPEQVPASAPQAAPAAPAASPVVPAAPAASPVAPAAPAASAAPTAAPTASPVALAAAAASPPVAAVAPAPSPPVVIDAAPEPQPQPQQDEDFPEHNDFPGDNDMEQDDAPEENLPTEAAEQDALEPPRPAASNVASGHMGGSRAFVPPPVSANKAEAEGSGAPEGTTVSANGALPAAPAKSSSDATGERSGGKGAVTGSDGGSAPAPAPTSAAPAPLIIRDWGSVGGGFVPFGASVQKTMPKGGKVLPQGSVKAKPSAAIGAALGPHLVLPNGNVSGPRACAPVEAFELPGSVAKGAPPPPAAIIPNGGSATPFDYHPVLASAGASAAAIAAGALDPAGAGRGIRPVGIPVGAPGMRPPMPKPPAAPKPKAKPRPLFEGEERKRGPAGRTSMYKGVTKHRRSGRWEAHVWVREDGKQAYLGGYSTEEEAAEAHDVAALKCHGLKAKTNFHISRYTALLDRLDSVPMNELVMAIRRTSPGFTRGSSSFRGVTQHKSGRWEVRIGLRGSKHVYLGLHSSEVEAARVYDRALVLLTGSSAATNFPVSNFNKELEAYQKRIDNGEQLPGFHNDGEYSEHAFEAWLRDAAIMPAATVGTNTRIVDAKAGPSPADAEAAQAEAAEEPKPKPKPKRRRTATAAAGGGVIDEGSEASSRPALADNGSPRPAVKRRRTSHVGRPNKQSQHVHDGMLDLSQVGKPKQGRPGPRRKATEAAETDTAAILMQMAAVAEGLGGRAPPNKRSRLPTWNRGPARQMDDDMVDDDVEISDDDEPMPQVTTRGRRRPTSAPSYRRGPNMATGRAAKVPTPIAQHRFTSPAALLEAIVDDPEVTKSAVLQALTDMHKTRAQPSSSVTAARAGLAVPDFVLWLGLVSAVGRLAHGMLEVVNSEAAAA